MSFPLEQPIALLPELLAVCRLPAQADLPKWAIQGSLVSIVRSPDELSIVCDQRHAPPGVEAERNWRALKVLGPLDFSMVGVLAGIANVLTLAGVSIFVISTYETDYILVKEKNLERTIEALIQAGYTVVKNANLSS